jgi:hypothetical protein
VSLEHFQDYLTGVTLDTSIADSQLSPDVVENQLESNVA